MSHLNLTTERNCAFTFATDSRGTRLPAQLVRFALRDRSAIWPKIASRVIVTLSADGVASPRRGSLHRHHRIIIGCCRSRRLQRCSLAHEHSACRRNNGSDRQRNAVTGRRNGVELFLGELYDLRHRRRLRVRPVMLCANARSNAWLRERRRVETVQAARIAHPLSFHERLEIALSDRGPTKRESVPFPDLRTA